MFTQKGNFVFRIQEHLSYYDSPSSFPHLALWVLLNVPPSTSCLVSFSKLGKVPVHVSYSVNAECTVTQAHWRTNKPIQWTPTSWLNNLYWLEWNLLILGMVTWGSFHNCKHRQKQSWNYGWLIVKGTLESSDQPLGWSNGETSTPNSHYAISLLSNWLLLPFLSWPQQIYF